MVGEKYGKGVEKFKLKKEREYQINNCVVEFCCCWLFW